MQDKTMTDKPAKKVAQPKTTGKPKTAKSTAAPRKAGRPTIYTRALADKICEEIATTTRGLKRICADNPKFPAPEVVRRWLYKDHDGFVARYARAKEQQQELQEDELLDIADEGTNDTYVDDEGRVRVDTDVIQRSRLRIDTRKWLMSKLKPKKYGDKVDLSHDVPADSPLAQLFSQVAGTPFKPKSDD